MKKTLITLLALAGVAAADSTVTPIASVTDYEISSSGFVSFSDTSSDWAAFDGKIDAAAGFTLQITLTDWSPANGPLFYLSTANTHTTALYNTSLATPSYSSLGNGEGWSGACLHDSTNGSMKSPSVTYSPSNTLSSLPSHSGRSIDTTLFVTGKNGSVTLYEVGTDFQLVQVCSTTNVSTGVAQSIVFAEWARENGSHTTNGNRATMSVSAYDGILTKEQMTALVPEPTTATLSLLALAGLAVRRRRK